MPLKYVLQIKEARSQIYEELNYRNQLKEILKVFREKLFWIKIIKSL